MDIVGLGTPVMDLVVNVNKIPPLDGACQANEIFNQGGGKVATAMAAAARLGCSAGMLAKIGGNRTGEFVREDLLHNGVDVSRLLMGEPDTSSAFCISLSEEESKTRIFIGRSKSVGPLAPEMVDYDYIAQARCLHLESGDPASTAAAKFAKAHGITVSMDGDHYQDSIVELMPYLDVFIGSEFFFRDMFGEADCRECCQSILDKGPSTVIFTFGSKGCKGLSRDSGWFEVPCRQVTVIDTTGAGDVFHGAYLVALLEGKTARECAEFATAVSGIKCTKIGGRTGIPNRRTVDRYLDTGVIDSTELDQRLAYYRNIL